MGWLRDKLKAIHGTGRTVEELSQQEKRQAAAQRAAEQSARKALVQSPAPKRPPTPKREVEQLAVVRRAPLPPYDDVVENARQVCVSGSHFGRDCWVRLDETAVRALRYSPTEISLRIVTRHGGLYEFYRVSADKLPDVLARSAYGRR